MEDTQIITIRTVHAPQELVFLAWTDPAHLAKWWGPAGFTNTFNEFDLRPGGKWSFIMHGPEKGNYVNEVIFTRIEKPSLIEWDRSTNPLFRVLATFDKVTDKTTKVTFRMIFKTKEERDKIKPFVVDKNEENFDKLEAELKLMN
jgi:uncharacterized protein YndB with AHSA1/START domain